MFLLLTKSWIATDFCATFHNFGHVFFRRSSWGYFPDESAFSSFSVEMGTEPPITMWDDDCVVMVRFWIGWSIWKQYWGLDWRLRIGETTLKQLVCRTWMRTRFQGALSQLVRDCCLCNCLLPFVLSFYPSILLSAKFIPLLSWLGFTWIWLQRRFLWLQSTFSYE